MSTRSMIALQTGEGKNTRYKAIYCHYDGYPENNGVLLETYWSDTASVVELMELGDLSILGKRIGEKVDFDSFKSYDDPVTGEKGNDQCLAYDRDRGEKDPIFAGTVFDGAELHDTFKDSWCEYLYVYTVDGIWECYDKNMKEIEIP